MLKLKKSPKKYIAYYLLSGNKKQDIFNYKNI